MKLTGVTNSMVDKAIRDEPLLREHVMGQIDVHRPAREALLAITGAAFEHYLACFDETDDPQARWDGQSQGMRENDLRVGAWMLGKLWSAGFYVAKRP